MEYFNTRLEKMSKIYFIETFVKTQNEALLVELIVISFDAVQKETIIFFLS